MAHPETYDDGNTLVSFWRPKGIKHTVTANEEGSGLANITIFPNPTGSDEMLFVSQITDANNQKKSDSGIVMRYAPSSGVIIVENASYELAENDVITIIGMKYV